MSEMSIHEVLQYLPHRYPFLLIDRVVECELGVRLKAIKNVSYNEPFFPGHFPSRPVFPGVLILEAMAQATGLLAFRTEGVKPDGNTLYLFVGVDKARFKRQVSPGDQLEITAELQRTSRGVWRFACAARVDGAVACEADLMGAMREIGE
ncbi:MAG: 3-hydroxyacyl-ACP dehydratase FabZ [Halofilum sp. (in: g-proteobacteria)]|nr:3-hydroxyacyl-ACP dehydratase FabZ [Halofilum sp. (in: g-proteobacteria)]